MHLRLHRFIKIFVIMRSDFISILITNYNKEKFLKKCLDSVYSQNYKNYEIILYDDCLVINP